MIIAIDPGLSGAVAHLTDAGRFCCVDSMPTVDGEVSPVLLAELLEEMRQTDVRSPPTVVLERVGARPGQGVTSMFRFGTAFGVALGVVGTLRLPMTLVSPQVWKRDMGLSKDKEASRLKALQLFPDAAEMLKRKKDEGRAEALLLGLWHVRRLQVQHASTETTAA